MAISDIVKNAGGHQLRELAEAGVRAKQALRGVREHAVKTMGEVIGTAEAGVTAFGFGSAITKLVYRPSVAPLTRSLW